jgi:predicted nucleic acid-binding protein
VIVVDASALALALLDDGPLGDKARTVLTNDTDWAAPAHLLTEVRSVIRGHVLGSKLTLDRAGDAITTLTALTISLSDCQPLLPRIWQLRHNLTSYDAAYAALAESLDASLATADTGLTNASGITCTTIAI